MTAPSSQAVRKRVVALFTDVLAVGGVQEAGRLTCRALADIARALGWAVELLSVNDPWGRHAVPGCDADIQVRGFARNKLPFVLAALAQAWSMKSRGIVIAAHPHLALPAAWMQRIRPSLRIIVMSYGIDVWKPLPRYRRFALRAADLVTVPSSDTERRLIKAQGIVPSKVRRLRLPLTANFLRMASDPTALKLPANFPNGRIILTVGRWAADERYKGADDLIRAVALLRAATPEVQLVAVGSGDDLPRLRAIAVELQIAECVHFLQNLSNAEVAACYAHCDLFALPSTGEGYGLVFLEAMAFGKAVVGVAAGGVTDIVRHGENGLLVGAGDFGCLVQALERLLKDDALRARLGRAGAEIVSRDYGFDAFRARVEEILLDCTVGTSRA
jgi:phosphatidyl-myo-inositol dimannoside synthase